MGSAHAGVRAALIQAHCSGSHEVCHPYMATDSKAPVVLLQSSKPWYLGGIPLAALLLKHWKPLVSSHLLVPALPLAQRQK